MPQNIFVVRKRSNRELVKGEFANRESARAWIRQTYAEAERGSVMISRGADHIHGPSGSAKTTLRSPGQKSKRERAALAQANA